MKYPSIRIEGAILSADILDKIEQGMLHGQKEKDFGFEGKNVRVKDEIVKAWADAQDMWHIFKRRMEAVPESKAGTTETRNFWIVPLLGLLGYEVELYKQAQVIHGKTYAISHRTANLDNFPIHIMGFKDSLDKKRLDSGPRMSPHALIQEYINLHEHLYAIVSNGLTIRLLRDSSRLIKLSFMEFDLERMFDDEHFADFALLYRLLHISRMPLKHTEGAESLIETYHQDSLDSGSRIRDGLSAAVEYSIKSVANGFVSHPANNKLRKLIEEDNLIANEFYKYQLRFIYRLLFLMVIEERDLIFTSETPKNKKDIYNQYYSVNRIRKLSEKRYLADKRYSDVWINLKNTFRLFESAHYGNKLNISPLSGDLFGYNAIGILNECDLDNKVLLECLKHLSIFTNPDTGQKMRVNYASLNVEEFGSVYEGLLEYEPVFNNIDGTPEFQLVKGDARSSSGSHYTPDELVQPLIKHSLEYIIEDKLKEPDKEKALLSIKVCDVASGSGHILLNAARRIATDLAKVRTGEDQPSPTAFREAVRDVIRHCIYGVDKNPLAVELCKIALWLEAHNPGEPLNFLDHHIKCGDSIVGLAHMEELQKGIAEEAFKRLPDDDKDVCASLRKLNKTERNKQLSLDFEGAVGGTIKDIAQQFRRFSELPERTPEEIEEKTKAYLSLTSGEGWYKLKTIADIQVAQFFIPKDKENQAKIITDGTYRQYLAGIKPPHPQTVAKAMAVANEKKFFHWFLEFPEVFAEGGFDCILGNPPYLGGQDLSGTYGHTYCNYVKWEYVPAGLSDLVVYFVRRIYFLLRLSGFTAFITTNSIKDGDIRKDGLEQILNQNGAINFALRGIKWPGRAKLIVSLIGIHKGKWRKKCFLDRRDVSVISAFLEDTLDAGTPEILSENFNRLYQGSILLGDGFLLTHDKAEVMKNNDPRLLEVVFPLINGHELNNSPEQSPGRQSINFFDWPIEKAKQYGEAFQRVYQLVKPDRDKVNRAARRERWWQYAERATGLYKGISGLQHCFAAAATTKYLSFSALPTNYVFTHALYIFTTDRWDLFAIVQSTAHEIWSRKYSGALGATLRYSPKDCFGTYPFPKRHWQVPSKALATIGERYHEHRRQIMISFQIGLTKTYNLFHKKGLSIDNIEKVSNHPTAVCEKGYQDILKLRELHVEMDNAVLSAYGWTDLNLAHDFYEVDYLPENDRIRFTISPEARREVLKRLLKRNHEIHEQEVKAGLWDKKKKAQKKVKPKAKADEKQGRMF